MVSCGWLVAIEIILFAQLKCLHPMHPLYQRLRELDWDTFQRLVFQLLAAKHPGIEIRHVEGTGGDRGLDLFAGEVQSRPAIWQCKHFPNGLGPRQRPQVKESLRTALKYFQPSQWILVLSTDLDRKGHEWFQKLQESYKHETDVGIFQGSDLVRELIHRRSIRDAFFPGAVLDTITIAQAIKALDPSSSERVEQLAKEEADVLIAKLEEADSRFNYQIVYGPNVGASIAESPPAHPLLVASVVKENRRIDLFARDLPALLMDPPKVSFTINESGFAKFEEFLRTGKRQEFEIDEVSNPKSTLDFLFSEEQTTGWKVILEPSLLLTSKVLSLRVTFANKSEQVTYELIQFRISSRGTEQVEIQSISPLPLVLSFCLALVPGKDGSFRVEERFEGSDVRAACKAIRAMSLLREGGSVHFYSLEIEKPIGTLSVTEAGTRHREQWENIIANAARVSERFNVDLRVPRRITREDVRSLGILTAIAGGELLPFESINTRLIKTLEHESAVTSAIGTKLQLLAQFPKLDPLLLVFGTAVDTGPISIMASEATIDNDQEFMDRYKNAKYGEGVLIQFNMREVRAQLGTVPAARVYFKRRDE